MIITYFTLRIQIINLIIFWNSTNQTTQSFWNAKQTLLPTLVPKEFAVSLAPIANARIEAMKNPTMIAQNISSWNASNVPRIADFLSK